MNDRGKLCFLAFVLCAGICSRPNWACAQDGNADLPDSPSQVSRSLKHAGNPDRKSTRLNSSHLGISYAVFCLKKKKLAIALSPECGVYRDAHATVLSVCSS